MALLLRANKVVDGKSDILVDSGQIIIGRLPSSNLVLPGSDVDPIHAMVEMDDNGATIIDMGSDTGVKLNGKRIEVVEPIKPGDIIEIGSIKIEVLDPSAVVPEDEEQPADDADTPQFSDAKKPPLPPLMRAPAAMPVPPLIKEEPIRKTVFSPQIGKETLPPMEKFTKTTAIEQDEEKADVSQTARIGGPVLFTPSKARPTGSTLEVVAFWGQNIVDVRHYGKCAHDAELELPAEVYIGNEEDGHMIGVGSSSTTRNYKLATVRDSKTNIHLNSDMKAKIRRGGQFEKVSGPQEFSISSKEIAFVKHGPIDYFFMNVAVPNPALKNYEDLEGRPLIFIWAFVLYLVMSGLILFTGPSEYLARQAAEQKPWEVIPLVQHTPTPKPTVIPPPKPPVVIPQATAIPTPKAVVKHTPPPLKVKPEPAKQQATAPKPVKKSKDNAGPITPNKPKGGSGGAMGGTSGAKASEREGKEKTNLIGQENEKKGILGAINFDKLGGSTPKTSDLDAIGAINIGNSSKGGSVGGGAGTGKRGALGMGGVGKGSNSLSSGGFGSGDLALGGGAGEGSGGIGHGASMSGKLKQAAVHVDEEDVVTQGSLTKAEIEGIIRANLNKIRACYERNLQGNRDLQGRVLTSFIIGTDGRVQTSKVKESTLRNGATEACVTDEIKRWKFPLPRGNGTVSVTYPFVFSPAN